MTNPVVHFEIQADDIARAKKFYEAVLGWKVDQMMSKEKGGMDYWGLTTRPEGKPGINGGLYERAVADQKLNTFDCTVQVKDLDAMVESVKKHGGTITKDKSEIPGVGWFARAVDTEGNIFGLMQPTEWEAK